MSVNVELEPEAESPAQPADEADTPVPYSVSFLGLLQTWRTLADDLITMKHAFVMEEANAIAKGVHGSNAEERKARLALAFAPKKMAIEKAELRERAAYHHMMHMRGNSDD